MKFVPTQVLAERIPRLRDRHALRDVRHLEDLACHRLQVDAPPQSEEFATFANISNALEKFWNSFKRKLY